MSLMGTLAKVAIGYAAARGVDQFSGAGMANLFGGAQVSAEDAETDHAPGIGNMQDMMQQMASGSGLGQLQDNMQQFLGASGIGNMQEIVDKFAGQSGIDLSAFMGGEGKAGAGLAGLLSAFGGIAAMGGKTAGSVLDQFASMGTAPQGEETAGLLLRAMIQAAKADGDIDASEQERILETVGDDADADDIEFVRAQMAAPVDVAGLAAATPAPMAMQVYSMSLMSIRVDTDGEARYLDELANALGLNQETVNMLHVQMGLKPLYS